MSYIGDPYRYDVFVSYPHAVEALGGDTTLRDWSRTVVDGIVGIVKLSLGPEGSGKLDVYLDRDRARAGDPLTDTLESAVQRSALLVVLLSPFYKKWCLQELGWFLEKAQSEGRGFRQCCLLEVQNTPAEDWPSQLRDRAGEPLFSKRLVDEDGLPLGYDEFMANGRLPDTKGLLRAIAIEIRGRLVEERGRLEAVRSFEASKINRWTQAPPEDLLIYLEAEAQDQQIWSARRKTLKEARAVVLPDEPIEQGLAQRSESALSIYKDCDALILHRARPDDAIVPRIRRAFQDRRLLYQSEQKAMPWAVLDELPDVPLPSADTFNVPRVFTNNAGWPDELFQALRGAPAGPAAAA